MKNKYICWNEELEIQKYANGAIKMTVNDHKGYNSRHFKKQYIINDTAVEIISLINGTKTYEEVVNYLSIKYNENYENINKKVQNFLDNMANAYGIRYDYQEPFFEKNICIKSGMAMYPSVASIELTNRCNVKCLHCYGEFNDNSSSFDMPIERAKHLLYELYNIGVKIIELTGGEISIYPHLEGLLTYALTLEFEHIALLTNGVNIPDNIMNIIINNKQKFIVQIDLHSLNDDYLTWFTKVPNTLYRVKNNIELLAHNDIIMRVATMVTPKNMDETEEIADWVHNLGITKFGISPIVKMGRAMSMEKELLINEESAAIKFNQIITRINDKYRDFISIIQDGAYDRQSNKNCGCMSSHVVISSNGNVKMCTMDNMKYFNSVIGNIFDESLKDIYDKNREYLNEIHKVKAPKHDSIECVECKNRDFCSNCILRGFIKASELKEDCNWYNNKVSEKIKRKLLI